MFYLSLLFSLIFTLPSTVNAGKNRDVSHASEMKGPLEELKEDNEKKTALFEMDPDSIAISYKNTKTAAESLRVKLQKDLWTGTITLDHVKKAFTNQLVNEILPHWYGTPWSFGGHTEVPNQGKIACGYFISTTLRDMGVKLNRYTLAQKSPLDEAKMISCGSEIKSFVQETPENALAEIDRLTHEGLYFIGFDEGHVGYLLKRDGELLLIHSNYFSPVSVCMEKLNESRVLTKFKKFHLVAISHNEPLLQRWLENGTVL
ncbi:MULTISPECIES: hypothetical protein [Maribacter]|uniref:NlpC/P60 family protein n=1 Tax=Maribacter flavus TaxID=1658664 RepID=A0A5B2TS67_9FLAO|nr:MULTISPECIES: hypothetical protein [Maribacter]KAA2216963.1 hypothetical protein F0361_13320 [Maribacter flavus]MDC6405647.1 hypothetical protein [Maribacter sp. PR66]MEE1972585.1 hypothetical protein [Maribacter flavus]